jgi:hypothetical protein
MMPPSENLVGIRGTLKASSLLEKKQNKKEKEKKEKTDLGVELPTTEYGNPVLMGTPYI